MNAAGTKSPKKSLTSLCFWAPRWSTFTPAKGRLAAVPLLLAVAGCAAPPSTSYKPAPGSQDEGRERAYADCRMRAEDAARGTAGVTTGGLLGIAAVADARQRAMTDCMRAKGYVLAE